MNTKAYFGTCFSPSIFYDSFLFNDLRNVDDAASTHGALPRLHFTFTDPFMSTLHTHPLCHASSLPSNLDICIKALNFFHHKIAFTVEKLLGLEPSMSSACFAGRFDLNFFRYEGYFSVAFGAFTLVSLNYLVWGFQVCAFVENKTAFFANYLLRQAITAVVEQNTIVTNYLCITTLRRSPLERLFPIC